MKTKRYRDPVVEAYLPGVDRTLLRENLKLTYEQRALKHQRALERIDELKRAGTHSRFLGKLKTTGDVFKYLPFAITR